jgi:hypothetical protein
MTRRRDGAMDVRWECWETMRSRALGTKLYNKETFWNVQWW